MPAGRLEFRAAVLRQIRAFFDNLGFVEVDTPVRIAAPAPEVHIDCPPSLDKFLRASPELQMKKLLAAGMEKIYQLGPCFRLGENGRRHSEEFTMLEWYRKDAGYLDILRDMEELLKPWTHLDGIGRITVREAYLKHAGWDPFAAFDQDRFDLDMATKVEPNLKGWVFLMDYPPECASLAKLAGGHAERWELYFNGLELANAFTELCDGDEQRRRFALAREERLALGEADYPLDEEFLGLLPLIGSAAGVALGVDRLLMAISGAANIAEVRILDT